MHVEAIISFPNKMFVSVDPKTSRDFLTQCAVKLNVAQPSSKDFLSKRLPELNTMATRARKPETDLWAEGMC